MTDIEDILPPSSPTMVHQHNLLAIEGDLVDDQLDADLICTMFNEFLHEFEQMEQNSSTTTEIFLDAVEEIANAVLQIKAHKLLDPKVISHPLLRFLSQMLVDIVRNWRASEVRLNIQESDIFLKIALIFVHATNSSSPENAEQDGKKIRDIVATKQLLALIREQVSDSAICKKGLSDDPNICTLGFTTIKLLSKYPFYFSKERNDSFFDTLVYECIDSYDYLEALRKIQDGESISDIETFLLYDCWQYIPFVGLSSKYAMAVVKPETYVNNIYDEFLTRFEEAFDQRPSMTTNGLNYILERFEQILNIPNLHSLDKHASNVIDRLVKILQNPSATNANNDDKLTVTLKAWLGLSKNSDIRAMMRKRNLTSLFQQYTSHSMGEKRKLAHCILAEIMLEQDLENQHDFTSFFIDEIKQLDPNTYNPNLDITLASLNSLMEHNSIKDEFIKQGGLDILSAFVRDGHPTKQSQQQQEDALKILWSCAFYSPDALNQLKQDETLIKQVKDLVESSSQNQNSSLKKAAEGLLWKVEKEEKFLEEQAAEVEKKKLERKRKAKESGKDVDQVEAEAEEEAKYDMMISYSWADMELTHRIFKHLTEKLGYKVWLDQEQMHGSTIQAMANAVESADFILMCMSETYKRSANCQSEAEYAFNRKKHIVPLKMKKDYVADGWLGFILGTRMYIDFGTYDFDKAIELLDNEIRLQKKKRKEAKEIAKLERLAAAAEEKKSVTQEDEVDVKKTNKTKFVKGNVLNWDPETVRQFLLKQNLTSMIPICNGINGEELLNLHTMCQGNSASMFRSLKFELLHGCNRILPISTYLRFLSCMRSVTDDALMHSPAKSSTSDVSLPKES